VIQPSGGLLVSALPLACLFIYRTTLTLSNGQHQDDDPFILDAIDQSIPAPLIWPFRLIQPACMKGHDPYAYLKDVLTRLPTQKASEIEHLLPHQWMPD